MEAGALNRSAPRPAAGGTRTAAALAVAVALTVAFGQLADAAGLGLGTPLPPFFATWDPISPSLATPLWLAALAACAGAALPLAAGRGGPLAFAAASTLLALGARLALAALRGGTEAWSSMFGTDPEAANEYLPALPALDLGLGAFLDRYAELAPSLPIHPSAHPPGMLLLADWSGATDPRGFAALVVGVGVAAVPLTYLAGRRLELTERAARAAALLVAFSPAAMLYGVASADALFATLAIGTVLLLAAGGAASRIAGAVALAVASFFSWALLAAGAFSALVVAQREGLRRAAQLAAGAGLALAAFYGVLHAISGYDPLGVLVAANEAYELGIANARPWAFWVLGSPAAFAVAVGLPISWYAGRALGVGNPIAISLAAIVAVAALAGFSKAETERIWLFMAPLAALAAATVIPHRRLPLVIALLVAQAFVVELTVETVW